jgi:hypothetical protein
LTLLSLCGALAPTLHADMHHLPGLHDAAVVPAPEQQVRIELWD